MADNKRRHLFNTTTLFLPEPTAIDTFYTDWRTVGYIPALYPKDGWTAECRNGNHN